MKWKFEEVMAVLGQHWTKHRDYRVLLAALDAHESQLPPWMFAALRTLVVARVPKRQKKDPDRDWTRWGMVRHLLDRKGVKWKDVYDEASERLGGRDAHNAPGTMKDAYERIERGLPDRLKRPRTYRRRH